MIVPPQAVMLTAHVGDSLRCLIAKSRQAGVTRPALHKGSRRRWCSAGYCLLVRRRHAASTNDDTIKGERALFALLCCASCRRTIEPISLVNDDYFDLARERRERTLFFSIVPIDLLSLALVVLDVVTTHPYTHEPRNAKFAKKNKKLHSHANAKQRKTHEETPKNSRSRKRTRTLSTLIVFVRFCSFCLVCCCCYAARAHTW